MRSITIATAMMASLSIAAARAQAPDWSRAQQVDVQLSSFKFTPPVLNLQHGIPYRIRLTNTSTGGHNFAAKEFFQASSIAPEDQPKLNKGRIEVGGGETMEIRLVPLRAGNYKLSCTHFLHTGFGMKGAIVVN